MNFMMAKDSADQMEVVSNEADSGRTMKNLTHATRQMEAPPDLDKNM